jgi:hypothetical protein
MEKVGLLRRRENDYIISGPNVAGGRFERGAPPTLEESLTVLVSLDASRSSAGD